MSLKALTHADSGVEIIPQTPADWDDWVSASATRNFAMDDPLLDWLDPYGEAKGFRRDNEYPDYDERTDFTRLVFEQGRRFEGAIVAYLKTLMTVQTIGGGPADSRDFAKAQATHAAMCEGIPTIHHGVIWDAEHRTYGAPDLLIRSDVLANLVPSAIPPGEVTISAPAIGREWHYRVVDVKFSTLHLTINGELDNSRSSPAYKLQVHIYNRALGRLQGWTPPVAYMLGRGWEQGGKRGTNCLDCLAPIRQHGTLSHGRLIATEVHRAADWVRRLRRQGDQWQALPTPSTSELYPTMTNVEDGPWHHAKREIAAALEELTLLWYVGASGRCAAHDAGVFRWRDPACTPAVVGITGPKRPRTLEAILEVNRTTDGPPVRPVRVHVGEKEWRPSRNVEFYADFETVTDLADDFSRIPERGGQPLIFIIGCGHLEAGRWQFRQFVADYLTEPSEACIINDWIQHMAAVQRRLDPGGDPPIVFHWAHAEPSTFETAYNSAKARHPSEAWTTPRFFDLHKRVMREEPVVVRGAFAFGLKAIAQALQGHGLIMTRWEDGPSDGLGAMVGAWWCYEEAKRQGVPVAELDLMQEIMRYNEVDCRVMMEIVQYLRARH